MLTIGFAGAKGDRWEKELYRHIDTIFCLMSVVVALDKMLLHNPQL
ncbi:MAG TPA: hypothetical protein V6C85_24830 [Allocoleopsis sp.]